MPQLYATDGLAGFGAGVLGAQQYQANQAEIRAQQARTAALMAAGQRAERELAMEEAERARESRTREALSKALGVIDGLRRDRPPGGATGTEPPAQDPSFVGPPVADERIDRMDATLRTRLNMWARGEDPETIAQADRVSQIARRVARDNPEAAIGIYQMYEGVLQQRALNVGVQRFKSQVSDYIRALAGGEMAEAGDPTEVVASLEAMLSVLDQSPAALPQVAGQFGQVAAAINQQVVEARTRRDALGQIEQMTAGWPTTLKPFVHAAQLAISQGADIGKTMMSLAERMWGGKPLTPQEEAERGGWREDMSPNARAIVEAEAMDEAEDYVKDLIAELTQGANPATNKMWTTEERVELRKALLGKVYPDFLDAAFKRRGFVHRETPSPAGAAASRFTVPVGPMSSAGPVPIPPHNPMSSAGPVPIPPHNPMSSAGPVPLATPPPPPQRTSKMDGVEYFKQAQAWALQNGVPAEELSKVLQAAGVEREDIEKALKGGGKKNSQMPMQQQHGYLRRGY